MKTSLLYFILSIALFILPSCCDCDEPEVYTITSEDISILPINADRDSIKFKNTSGNLYYASSSQNCEDEEEVEECITCSGKSIGCNCPDSKDDECEYNLYINDAHFSISFIRNVNGLSTKFILNGQHITHTNTINSYTFRNQQYSNVMVFEYGDPSTRVAVDGEIEVANKTLYAPGYGLLQMVSTDGQVLKLAE